METSRSILVKKFGSYDALSVEDYPLPPLEDLIEVEVEYGGVNFADLYTRQGLMATKKLPFVLGIECTGTIKTIGPSAPSNNLKVGQRVICYDYQGGMYRQNLRIGANKCYPIPNEVSTKEAAAIFVNYLTAYFTLFHIGNLKENENVLMLSCAGGVGWAVTQLAKTVDGVIVYGTASPDKHREAEINGVNCVLSLEEDFENMIKEKCPKGFDLIICNQSGALFTFLQSLLKPLGRIVLIGANNLIQNEHKLSVFTLLKAWLGMKNVSLEELIVKNRVVGGLHLGTLIEKNEDKVREILERIFILVVSKKIKPRIHSIHSMDNIVQATKLLAERKNIGKVLISF